MLCRKLEESGVWKSQEKEEVAQEDPADKYNRDDFNEYGNNINNDVNNITKS